MQTEKPQNQNQNEPLQKYFAKKKVWKKPAWAFARSGEDTWVLEMEGGARRSKMYLRSDEFYALLETAAGAHWSRREGESIDSFP